EHEARLVTARAEVIVAAIYAAAHDRRAAAGRHPQAAVAETGGRQLHRDVEPLGDAADLLPERRRVSPERALLAANVEPRRQPDCLAEKCLALARQRKGSRLRAADLVGRAATLHKADAKRLGHGRHCGALGENSKLLPL